MELDPIGEAMARCRPIECNDIGYFQTNYGIRKLTKRDVLQNGNNDIFQNLEPSKIYEMGSKDNLLDIMSTEKLTKS